MAAYKRASATLCNSHVKACLYVLSIYVCKFMCVQMKVRNVFFFKSVSSVVNHLRIYLKIIKFIL